MNLDSNIKFIKEECEKLDIALDLNLERKDVLKINFLRLHLRCMSAYLKKNNIKKIKKLKQNLLNTKLYSFVTLNIFVCSFIYKDKSKLCKIIFEEIFDFYRRDGILNLNKIYLKFINFINYHRTIRFRKNIIIDSSTTISNNINLTADGEFIRIGKNSTIHPFVLMRLWGGSIKIGDNTYIHPYSVLYGHGGLIIGNNVLIAAHTTIIPANHDFERIDVPICNQGEKRQGIVIEDDVWIGSGVKILDGVVIRKGSIVGAGSVVTKSTDAYSINLGVPAKKVKSRLPDLKQLKFQFKIFQKNVSSYIKTLQSTNNLEYKFTVLHKKSNLYSTVYGLLINYYINHDFLTEENRTKIKEYLDSFQNYQDGLWYDNSLLNTNYKDSDWWGARHLAVHIIELFIRINMKPKYKISYVEKFYNIKYLQEWLNSINWTSAFSDTEDIDNKIMNIGVALQYNRDYFKDEKAETSLNFILDFLETKLNLQTGMWGGYDVDNPVELSRSIQFAYHLYKLFFHENREIKFKDRIKDLVLKNQNDLGGYGENIYTSACEDIDSIEFLIHLAQKDDVNIAILNKSLTWVLYNQNEDGGFVFRKNEKFWYGHESLSALENESNIFATWFRTLSVIKICSFLNIENDFQYSQTIGY